MDEQRIQAFWNTHPCGEGLVGGLHEKFHGDFTKFFDDYDTFRYRTEKHILDSLDQIPFSGKNILEIGLGQGSESEQIIRRGANWYGLDLTAEAIARVSTRLEIRGLSYKALKQGSACDIPFPSQSFDLVFSHGVLHHIPDIQTAQREIARVFKPTGELVVMVYARISLNYLVSISVARRLGLLSSWIIGLKLKSIYAHHLQIARREGIWTYLKISNFIHRNTDGPLNPYSKLYDRKALEKDFPDFKITNIYKRFMHAPPLPVQRLPLQSFLGWHLWAHMKPRTLT